MIQRIQTVYLLLAAILCAVAQFCNIARFADETDIVATLTNYTFDNNLATDIVGPWPFGVLLIFIVLLNLVSILLFNYRMRQLRLTIFSTILLVGYIGAYVFMMWFYGQQFGKAGIEAHYELAHGAVYPLVSIILNCMAIRGIRRDEALVRSLDRLR